MNCHGKRARFTVRIGRTRWWACDRGGHGLHKTDGCPVSGQVKREAVE